MIKTHLDKFDTGDFHPFLDFVIAVYISISPFPSLSFCLKRAKLILRFLLSITQKQTNKKDTNSLFHFAISKF